MRTTYGPDLYRWQKVRIIRAGEFFYLSQDIMLRSIDNRELATADTAKITADITQRNGSLQQPN